MSEIFATLFRKCMTAILDGVAAGQLVNFDNAPVGIREMIFAKVQMLMSGDHVPSCLTGSRFFNNFRTLHLVDSIDCGQYHELLSAIASELQVLDSKLGSTLVSLRLRVCIKKLLNTNQRSDLEASSNADVVCRLISVCRNLRRLDISLCPNCWPKTAWEMYLDKSGFLSDIGDALRPGALPRMPLEELTLRNCYDVNVGTFTACESLRLLKLHHCSFSTRIWPRLLQPCRRTLQILTLNCCKVEWCRNDQPFDGVQLEALHTLIVNCQSWYTDQRLLFSPETIRRAQHGLVCIGQLFENETPAHVVRRISPKLEIAFCLQLYPHHLDGLTHARNLFGQRLVELRIVNEFKFYGTAQLDEMIGQLVSIRVLVMDQKEYGDSMGGTEFLNRFLSDVGRSANLRRLQIRWQLQPSTLRLVFQNCVNLEFLFLVPPRFHCLMVGCILDQDLIVWAANGAKPKQVYLGFFSMLTVNGVNHLLRNCDDDFKASFLDERGRFVRQNVKVMEDVAKHLFCAT